MLCSEWDYQKNKVIHPENVTYGSDLSVWWRCKTCGHEWQARIANRSVLHRGCPACAGQVVTSRTSLMAVNPELCEEWNYEKNDGLIPENFLPGSNKKVWWKCKTCGHEWQAGINNRTTGTGCPVCKGSVVTENNNLKIQYPQITEEWDYSKNDTLPENVRPNSNKKLNWKCRRCGHEWEASPATRIKGHGCPACSGRVATKDRNLSVLYPELCEEWDYGKNDSLTPSTLLPGSGKKIWWKCKTCGHEWQAAVYTRTAGSGCPKCNRSHPRKKT